MEARTAFCAGVLAALVGCGSPPATLSCGADVVDRGGGWREVGGPHAWLLFDPPYVAGDRGPRVLWMRVDHTHQMPATTLTARGPDGSIVEGFIQSVPVKPTDWAPGSGPPVGLEGVVFFAMLPLPSAGCWEMRIGTRTIDLGRARLEVEEPATNPG